MEASTCCQKSPSRNAEPTMPHMDSWHLMSTVSAAARMLKVLPVFQAYHRLLLRKRPAATLHCEKERTPSPCLFVLHCQFELGEQ